MDMAGALHVVLIQTAIQDHWRRAFVEEMGWTASFERVVKEQWMQPELRIARASWVEHDSCEENQRED
jgi:hypothetical protein